MIPIIILLTLVSCQPAPDVPLPTLAALPTATLTEQMPLNEIVSSLAAAAPLPTMTESLAPSPAFSPTPAPVQYPVTLSLPTDTPTPALTATPLPELFRFGLSVEGRELLAHRVGTGRRIIMLVGGIHTGFEANTVDLMEELIAHFRQTPSDVLAGVTLLIIPVLNPDGIPYGRQLRGRFNANGVDLNRNWGCRWQADAVFGDMAVDPGREPFSEPETRALGALIQQTQPAAVLFYHAAANGVFAGRCEEGVSDELTRVYAEAARYPFGDNFGDNGNGYEVTGDASVWVDGQGIPAAVVELATSTETEFTRNLRAIMALQRWLSPQ